MNQQHAKEPIKQQELIKETPRSSLDTNQDNNQGNVDNDQDNIDVDSDKNQWLGTPFNRVTDELVAARSRRVRFPSKYIKDIENGLGVADNRTSRLTYLKGYKSLPRLRRLRGR